MNRRELIAGAAILPLTGCAQPVPASPSYWIAGDSIGVGLGSVAGPGVHCVAEEGVAAHQLDKLAAQARLIPAGASVVLSLGTNDAAAYSHRIHVAPIFGLFEHCARALWVGPPEVSHLHNWAYYAQLIDGDLTYRLNPSEYVSIYDESCALERASDGIHFTRAGYLKLWSYILIGRY